MSENTTVYAGTTGNTIAVATDTVAGDIYQRVKIAVGADGAYEADVSSTYPLPIAFGGFVATGTTITRPPDTTAYAAGDLVASSTTTSTVNAAQTTVACARGTNIVSLLTGVQLIATSTVLTNAMFRIHFYNGTTTVVNGDNGAFSTAKAGYIGYADVTLSAAFSDGSWGRAGNLNMTFTPTSGTSSLSFLIEARAAYTPISGEVFTVVTETN